MVSWAHGTTGGGRGPVGCLVCRGFTDRSGDYLVVALEFIEIETTGALVRFFADLADVQRLPGLDLQWRTSHRWSFQNGRRRVVTTQGSFLPTVPGVGAFFLRAS